MSDSALPPPLPTPRRSGAWALWAILALALGVRLFGLNWDHGSNFHPDERRIAEAVSGMSFRPLQLNPRFFAYGSFPLYMTRAACSVASFVDSRLGGYDGAVLVGRALGAVWGTGAVLLVFLLGRRLFGRSTGLLAAALAATAVLPVQNAHFATNDIPLSTLVLLSLWLAVRAVDGGRLRDLALAGAVAGLALATKVSALPLLLPLGLVAMVRWIPRRDWTRLVAWGAAAGGAAALGFVVGQPYAVIDFNAFLHDVVEQSRMVRNAGLFPYTNQYVGVPKVVYDLREMVLWGMGPPLGLAALAGFALAVVRAWRERRAGEWLLLAWVVPFAAITMSFDVKFPRYLLPIYPLLILWGAVAIQQWAARASFGRWVRAAVVAGTAAYLAAFFSIYLRPHTVRAASEWFFTHVPPGSRVLSQDWDEGYPQHLPGRSPDIATVVTFPFYEPDGPAKVARLAREVASADFIALQTKRLYGATTQAFGRFPLTSNFFYLLFAGDLGYEILIDFTSRPALAGIELPSELADESFSVYDHPKVLIFRNRDRLTAEEVEQKIRSTVPSSPITRTQMLVAQAHTPIERSDAQIRSSLLAVVLVVGLVQLVGLAAWALLAGALGPARRGLYALGKPVGVLLVGMVSWWASSTGWLPFSRGTVLGAVALVLAAGVFSFRRFHPRVFRREILVSEVVVWGCFAVFLGLRLLNPAIFWGEKPMDFSFLNTLYRTEIIPPPEPWFAGSVLHYTYFGQFLVAGIGKALAIAPEVMFNLGIGLAAVLLASAALAAGTILGGRLRAGVWAVGFCMLAGNLAGPVELWARKAVNFDYFWATSRVIPNTINEFPAWSLIFADLHAHVLAMPWALTLVAVLGLSVLSPTPSHARRIALWGLAAVVLGAIMITNGWSTPTFLVLTAWVALVAWWGRSPGGGFGAWLRAKATRVVAPVLVVLGGALLATRPFWSQFTPPLRSWGWEVGPYARAWDVLLVFGLLWWVVVPAALVCWWRTRMAFRSPRSRLLVAGALGLVFVLATLDPAGLLGGQFRSARSVAALAAVLLLALLAGLRDARARFRLPLALAAMTAAMVLGCEVVFVWDRMNTVFKFYLDAWLLLSVAAGCLIALAATQKGWPGRLWRFGVGAAATAALFSTVSGAWGSVTHRHTSGPRWTLDGTAYLSRQNPHEKAAFDWLNRTVRGTPVIVEAFGPSYREYGRVSMNTGLPTVLGWEYHVFQRSQSRAAIEIRKRDIEFIYTSPDREAVAAALSRNHVALVFVGNVERRTYREADFSRFSAWPELLVLLYENPSVQIYGVRDNLPGTFPLAAREATRSATSEPDQQLPPGSLREPRGVACDAAGNAVIADFGNHRVQVLAPDRTSVASWGRRGDAPGEMNQPSAVAVDTRGQIYVLDTWNSRVQVFDGRGNVLREMSDSFFGPRGIAVDDEGTVWVADTGNHRIVSFAASGVLGRSWGGRGDAPGSLYEPFGLAIDPRGHLVVCDCGNGRVQIFSRDGALLSHFPVPGWRREVFSEPHVAIDADGRLWVTVPLAKELRAYTETGELLHVISGATLDPPLEIPVGIAYDPGSRVLVVTDIADRVVRIPCPGLR